MVCSLFPPSGGLDRSDSESVGDGAKAEAGNNEARMGSRGSCRARVMRLTLTLSFYNDHLLHPHHLHDLARRQRPS